MTLDENNPPSQHGLSTPEPAVPVMELEEQVTEADSDIKQLTEPGVSSSPVKKEAARMVADQVKLQASPATVSAMGFVANASYRVAREPVNRERYAHYDDKGIREVSESPVSTFSIDVDTGAYSNVRRVINAGNLPHRNRAHTME